MMVSVITRLSSIRRVIGQFLGYSLLVSGLVGCSQLEVEMTSGAEEALLPPGMARIVFIRSTPFNHKALAALYSVKGDGLEFIGILNNETRISHDIVPGNHAFMVAAGTVDYMRAEIRPGFTYYAVLVSGIGSSTRQFSLWPVRKGMRGEFYTDSSEFPRWLATTGVVKNNARTRQWDRDNRSRIKEMHDKLWPVWEKGQSSYEINEHTLHADDGLN
ncbi:MAG: hypothetical protein OEZ23_01715 [Gammaproteobacteria bacterium]|nr:hypothetical protein [Gammaproteobacteria bacterium]